LTFAGFLLNPLTFAVLFYLLTGPSNTLSRPWILILTRYWL
jgi:hypothetical protein